ncbi:MAG: hypothetical protein AAB453_00370 [Patescibacteria group bacterium]
MSRSRRRGRRVSNHNKPQVAVEANQASSKSPSIYCGVCGKGHDNGFPTWELPYGGKYNVIVTIPACGYCRDPKHFKDFLGMGGEMGPNNTADYLRAVAFYVEISQIKRPL